jgi:hypothetical protein
MVVGTIVGSSIFVQPSEVSRAVPTFGGMLLVWVVAGALTWFGASICAELTSALPRTGGVYVFLREMFSPAAGFLWGWAMFWSMHSGIIAAISMVFARYVATIVPLGDLGIRLTAVGGIVGLSAINYAGVRPGSAVQTGLTITKIAAIGVLLVVLLGFGSLQMPVSDAAIEPRAFLRALVAGLFAFGGWHMVTYAADETHNPERTIPRALMFGTAAVGRDLPGVERSVSAGAAARRRARVDAHRIRRHIEGRRERGRVGDLRPRDRVVARRQQRHHPRRPARLLRDGAGWTVVQVDGDTAPALFARRTGRLPRRRSGRRRW